MVTKKKLFHVYEIENLNSEFFNERANVPSLFGDFEKVNLTQFYFITSKKHY